MPILFPRKDKCVGSKQECETGTDTTNTLAICLAVIIPVVVVAIIIAFFIYKAYRRNKKEALEDDDPDFNVDNIMLPEYHNATNPPMRRLPAGMRSLSQANMLSSDSLAMNNPNNQNGDNKNPFADGPRDLNALNMKLGLHQTTSDLALPLGNTKEDLDRYSKNLGLDFHEFNYPIRKMNMPHSANSSPTSSRRNSVSSRTNNRFASKASSPQKSKLTQRISIADLQERDGDLNSDESVHPVGLSKDESFKIPPLHVVGSDSDESDSDIPPQSHPQSQPHADFDRNLR
ncbi:unnamed protein product [Pichia kudriavzevii]